MIIRELTIADMMHDIIKSEPTQITYWVQSHYLLIVVTIINNFQ